MKVPSFKTEFVEYIPEALQPGVLYVSMQHSTVAHLCACGCGVEVTTPLSPAGWQLFYDGRAVTLQPSIGNWSFDCRSHYFIRANQVRWASDMTSKQIAEGRALTAALKRKYYAGTEEQAEPGAPLPTRAAPSPPPPPESTPFARKRWWRSK